MNGNNEVVLNVINAWIKRAEDNITKRQNKIDFDFHENLKSYPSITTVITIEIHGSPYMRCYQLDKIVEYLTKKCKE